VSFFHPNNLIALATLITSLGGFIGMFRKQGKTHAIAAKTESLVNSQLDTQLSRNAELTATLTKAGVDVPTQKPPA